MGFQINQKKKISRKNILRGGNRRRSISRRRPSIFDRFRKEQVPVPALAPAVVKAPEVLIGEFKKCNEYLECLKSGQRSDNCNNVLDNQLIPNFQLNKACRQYKIYNSMDDLEAKNKMRRYLETSECDEECNTSLWKMH